MTIPERKYTMAFEQTRRELYDDSERYPRPPRPALGHRPQFQELETPASAQVITALPSIQAFKAVIRRHQEINGETNVVDLCDEQTEALMTDIALLFK